MWSCSYFWEVSLESLLNAEQTVLISCLLWTHYLRTERKSSCQVKLVPGRCSLYPGNTPHYKLRPKGSSLLNSVSYSHSLLSNFIVEMNVKTVVILSFAYAHEHRRCALNQMSLKLQETWEREAVGNVTWRVLLTELPQTMSHLLLISLLPASFILEGERGPSSSRWITGVSAKWCNVSPSCYMENNTRSFVAFSSLASITTWHFLQILGVKQYVAHWSAEEPSCLMCNILGST